MMHVLFAGPSSARPFMDQLAKAISPETADVQCRYDLRLPSDFEAWSETDILVAFAMPCSDQDMAQAPRLRAIVLPSLGFEGVDIAAATVRGIAVANGHVAENFETVAEAAFLFMLMSLYDVHAAEERLRFGSTRSGPPTARMMKGKTIGIIGFGNIAHALVRRLSGWGVDVLVTTRSHVAVDQANLRQCDLSSLLRDSDIILPLVPLTEDTHRMLSKAQLLSMKKGAILINLSRGAVIEEAALCDPNVIEHLGRIALDVFETEPLPVDSPLREHPKAILTAHEIAHTQENLRSLLDTAKMNILAAIDGKVMPTVLNYDY